MVVLSDGEAPAPGAILTVSEGPSVCLDVKPPQLDLEAMSSESTWASMPGIHRFWASITYEVKQDTIDMRSPEIVHALAS
jgi:hypothetical protein